MKKFSAISIFIMCVLQLGAGVTVADATRIAFSEGISRTVLVGTDCPDLSNGLLQSAFSALKNADLVIGPALDGGYYLIGR